MWAYLTPMYLNAWRTFPAAWRYRLTIGYALIPPDPRRFDVVALR